MSAQIDAQARQLAREAAQWLALQDAGELDAERAAALTSWRARSSAHEALWQKAEALRQRFSAIPAPLAVACLDRPDPQRRKLLGQALALGALAPLAWVGYQQLPIQRWSADLATATGERRTVQLADGSRLQLNTASAVDLAEADGRQQVQLLRGEIAVDSSGPLQVNVPQGRVLALGASFCVRLQAQGCVVSVTAGEVSLQPVHGAHLRLQAGQRVMLSGAGAGALHAFDAQQPGWRQGLLIVDNQPLGDFLRELDRYRPGLLRWDPMLERLAVTGTFQLDDSDRILALLAASLPVEVHYRTRYWVTLAPRKKLA
ncbi:transmembrane sensor [Pseudomonas hunanensis]|uniref:Transmembrane sensor n=1 Tax=Pseudomonas hunanensis TaxID=1247546 RepID=A0ACC6K919_9PSED|nr:FecR family protein [Pseudomonas hunanensis]MDR6714927.1 transmembrane sensor [Pseudomonas hunanensis]